MNLLSFRPGRVGGVETYVRQLVTWLPQVAPGDELILVASSEIARALPAPGWRLLAVPLGDGSIVGRRLLEAYTPWRARSLARLCADAQADVTFFPQQSIFPFEVEGPAVLTVVDVQHLLHPENFGLFDRTYRPRVYPRSMERSERIIAISGYTRDTLVERCAVPPGKVEVVAFGIEPLAPGELERIEPSALVGGEYLYYPAATYAHKGHEILFRSFAALRKRGAIPHRLVLSGQRTRLWKARLVPLLRDLGIERDVSHVGFVPFAEVRRLFVGASAVLFPSRFEGFGIPILEAVQYRRPILTSRLPVFDEIGVPAACQVDFGDTEALLAALRRREPTVLARPPLTWRACAERTVDVLRSAVRTQAAGHRGAG